MDIKHIYDYLNELSKCKWYDNAIENGIKYNDIDIFQGTEYYKGMLSAMQETTEQMLLELSADSQHQMLQALYGKITEIYNKIYDVISIEDVEALKRDAKGNTSPAIKADIQLGYFVVEMHGIQRFYQHTLLTFIGDLLGIPKRPATDDTVKPIPTQPINEPLIAPQSEDKHIIKGVVGLGKYLGCGTTKAQEILNSGILQNNDSIAYRAGKGWRINKGKLDKLLGDNPYVFKGKLEKRFDL